MGLLSNRARQLRYCIPSNFIYGDRDILFVHADHRYQDAVGVISAPALHLSECRADEIPGLICDAEPPFNGDDQGVIFLAGAVMAKVSL